jgi:dTDP-4-dehydrorhamnose 3,5-epimerase-like enzyme
LIKLQDTLVWIPPLWNNTTTNLSDNSETMYKV